MQLLSNNIDINNYFIQKTKLDFPVWFNNYQSNYGAFKGIGKINNKNWNNTWEKLSLIYPDKKLNLIEFLALNTILIIETKGTYLSQTDETSTNLNPGVSYMFNSSGKLSYNTLPGNQTAYDAFNDPNFIDQFQNLPLNNLRNTTNNQWHGSVFPKNLFSQNDLQLALSTSIPTFINECDFYKFRGRGFVKLIGRNMYKKLIEFIVNYNGNDSKLLFYKSKWTESPFNNNIIVIATRSDNQTWQELFTSIDLLIYALQVHIESNNNYHVIPLTTEASVEQKLKNMANKISNNNITYVNSFLAKINQQVNDLKDFI